ncbi:flagellar basal body protein, partial [Alkalibaculum bacchi]
MIRSLYTLNRNMNVLQKKQENVSANITNVNTVGYKFQDMVQSTL